MRARLIGEIIFEIRRRAKLCASAERKRGMMEAAQYFESEEKREEARRSVGKVDHATFRAVRKAADDEIRAAARHEMGVQADGE